MYSDRSTMKIVVKILQNPRPRAHRVLFDCNLPFRARVVKSQLEYRRQPKHKNAHQE